MRFGSNSVAILNHVETFLFESRRDRKASTRGKPCNDPSSEQIAVGRCQLGWYLMNQPRNDQDRDLFEPLHRPSIENIRRQSGERSALWYGNASWFIVWSYLFAKFRWKSLKIVENRRSGKFLLLFFFLERGKF